MSGHDQIIWIQWNLGKSPYNFCAIIAPSLCKIFNAFLQCGSFPKDWKQATITPVFKGGKKDDPGCYRPISLLSTVSKVMESFVFAH